MAVDIHQDRGRIVQIVFIVATVILLAQLLNLQLINTDFKRRAELAGASSELQYPGRGILFDRNGELLVVNKPIYDLKFIYNQFEKKAAQFDTLKFCNLLGIDKAFFEDALDINWRDIKHSKSKAELFLSRITNEQYATLQESLYQFPGFLIKERNVRTYPHNSAAHILGYISEVNSKIIKDSSAYKAGDYIGATGLEKEYEYYLRGKKGIKRVKKDIRGRVIGSLDNGEKDVAAESGYDIFTSLDLELQAYGEELMQNKIGGIVAIEPATGEILSMISTPSYDPSLLEIGAQRGQYYTELQQDSLLPFFNRGLQAQYPPGSLFKPIVALVGLQVGTLTADRGIPCYGAYYFNDLRLTGCHGHPYCANVGIGLQHSCNTYFVTAFREIIDRFDESTPRKGLDNFNNYLYNFGLGKRLGIDFPIEQKGRVPSSAYFDKIYEVEGRWHSIWVRSLGIGQGELETTNLQLANLAAAIANRGYYITPHLVRSLRTDKGELLSSPLATDKHYTGIDAHHFEPVIDGMEQVLISGTAMGTAIPGINVCGKTGTAENSQRNGADHSIFFAFAPRENPKIALAVYIENGGFGGTYAAPISSLLIEKYLNDSIADNRKWLEKRMLSADLINR